MMVPKPLPIDAYRPDLLKDTDRRANARELAADAPTPEADHRAGRHERSSRN